MKLLLALILVLVAATAFGFDCNVTCPTGYKGSCVKSDDACNCTCKKEAKDAASYILATLKNAGASEKLQLQVQQLLAGKEELSETTITDPGTGKKFSIFLKTQK